MYLCADSKVTQFDLTSSVDKHIGGFHICTEKQSMHLQKHKKGATSASNVTVHSDHRFKAHIQNNKILNI